MAYSFLWISTDEDNLFYVPVFLPMQFTQPICEPTDEHGSITCFCYGVSAICYFDHLLSYLLLHNAMGRKIDQSLMVHRAGFCVLTPFHLDMVTSKKLFV
jgi:hypothetical protein